MTTTTVDQTSNHPDGTIMTEDQDNKDNSIDKGNKSVEHLGGVSGWYLVGI